MYVALKARKIPCEPSLLFHDNFSDAQAMRLYSATVAPERVFDVETVSSCETMKLNKSVCDPVKH